MELIIGIDIGSRNTKIICLSISDKKIVMSECIETAINPHHTVSDLIEHCLSNLSCSHEDVKKVYLTGYGRKSYPADKVVSEILCHTIGVQYFYPQVKTIIDIGGQDSKIISINQSDKVGDFILNDKCAAGTGRFLEMISSRLGLPIKQLSDLATTSQNVFTLNSTCVVFAESEIIGMIAQGVSASDIARAVHLSVVQRIIAQMNQVSYNAPIVFTGGVAQNNDIRNILSFQLRTEILIPPEPEMTGAMGAALIALNDYE